MGIILKFEAPRGCARRVAADVVRKQPCEIVILPCIRYERFVETVQPEPMPQKKKARKPRARAVRRAQ